MNLLVAILAEEVLEVPVEVGVSGATVPDAEGMGKILAEVPIFAGLREALGGWRRGGRATKVVIAAVEEAAPLEEAVAGLDDVLGGPGGEAGRGGLVVDLPVAEIRKHPAR